MLKKGPSLQLIGGLLIFAAGLAVGRSDYLRADRSSASQNARAYSPWVQGVHWDFPRDRFDRITLDITIHNEPDNQDGLYFQLYNATINGVGFYFGLQTDVYGLPNGSGGRGLIFSRWDTRETSSLRVAEGGWYESAGYEGDFISTRRSYPWSAGRYRFTLARYDVDADGEWYGLWIAKADQNDSEFAGALRFPFVGPDTAGISNGGSTWTEIYTQERPNTPPPNWHVSIDTALISEANISPRGAFARYFEIAQADVTYDSISKQVHFFMGPEVQRTNREGRLF